MKIEFINALSTAVIAFVTVIATLVGFYYNLSATRVNLINIASLQILFLICLWQFIVWVTGEIDG